MTVGICPANRRTISGSRPVPNNRYSISSGPISRQHQRCDSVNVPKLDLIFLFAGAAPFAIAPAPKLDLVADPTPVTARNGDGGTGDPSARDANPLRPAVARPGVPMPVPRPETGAEDEGRRIRVGRGRVDLTGLDEPLALKLIFFADFDAAAADDTRGVSAGDGGTDFGDDSCDPGVGTPCRLSDWAKLRHRSSPDDDRRSLLLLVDDTPLSLFRTFWCSICACAETGSGPGNEADNSDDGGG